jgi:hypothetical protein
MKTSGIQRDGHPISAPELQAMACHPHSILRDSAFSVWEGGIDFPLHHYSQVVAMEMDVIHNNYPLGVMGLALEELVPQPSLLMAMQWKGGW